MSSQQTKKPRVVIAWMEKGQTDSIQTLSGHNGVRVYTKDEVDPRVVFNGSLRYYSSMEDALKYMRSHPASAVQIELKAFNKGIGTACPAQ